MADPTEIELLREATQLQTQCSDHLVDAEEMQRQRWVLLRRIIEDAGKQFTQMRLDAVEEGLNDEGAPLWFSVIVGVGLTLFPVELATTKFIAAWIH